MITNFTRSGLPLGDVDFWRLIVMAVVVLEPRDKTDLVLSR